MYIEWKRRWVTACGIPFVLTLVHTLSAVHAKPFQADRLPRNEEISQRPIRNTGAIHGARVERLLDGNDVDTTSITLRFVAFNVSLMAELIRHNTMLHPDVQLRVQGMAVNDDKSEHMEAVRHAQQHLYDGTVLDPLTGRYLGWARLLFHSKLHGGDDVHFEGIFTVDGDLHTVKSAHLYATQRRHFDDVAMVANGTQMVVWRESDKHDPLDSVSMDNAYGTGFGSVAVNGSCSAVTATTPLKRLHLHKRSDGAVPEARCGADNLAGNSDPLVGAHAFYQQLVAKYQETLQQRAQNLQNRLDPLVKRAAVPAGCPTDSKVMYIGMAADCSYVQKMGGSSAAIKQLVLDVAQASKIYESTFNVALGIVQFDVNSDCVADGGRTWNQACSLPYTIDTRLNDFSQWRGAKEKDNAGVWHLVTACSSGATMGIAWMNTICRSNITVVQNNRSTEYRTGAGVSTANVNEWMVVAHEIGHNFGAMHDCTQSTCPCSGPNCGCCPCGASCDCGNKYLMNPTANIQSSEFSPCTINQICQKMPVLGTCLQAAGAQKTVGENQCGNGVLEAGEECDCGDPTSTTCATDACCDAATCKLKPGAQCSDSNGECCKSCKLLPAGTSCRAAKSDCDIAETCDGSSGACPIDAYLPNGGSCQLPGAVCASGFCTSRDLQCAAAEGVNGSTACADYNDQCSIFCNNAASGRCESLSGFFVDGTPCGDGGSCHSGVCSGTAAFYTQPIVIAGCCVGAVAIVLGGVYWYYWRSKRELADARAERRKKIRSVVAVKRHTNMSMATPVQLNAPRSPITVMRQSVVPVSSTSLPGETPPSFQTVKLASDVPHDDHTMLPTPLAEVGGLRSPPPTPRTPDVKPAGETQVIHANAEADRSEMEQDLPSHHEASPNGKLFEFGSAFSGMLPSFTFMPFGFGNDSGKADDSQMASGTNAEKVSDEEENHEHPLESEQVESSDEDLRQDKGPASPIPPPRPVTLHVPVSEPMAPVQSVPRPVSQSLFFAPTELPPAMLKRDNSKKDSHL